MQKVKNMEYNNLNEDVVKHIRDFVSIVYDISLIPQNSLPPDDVIENAKEEVRKIYNSSCTVVNDVKHTGISNASDR